MKIRSGLVALSLSLGLAAPAFAAAKGSLPVTNNTLGGPGATSLATGSSEEVFSHPGSTDVCVTVANSGKTLVGVSITGASSASTTVPVGGTKVLCSDDTTSIDITCGEEANGCSAAWRVDEN